MENTSIEIIVLGKTQLCWFHWEGIIQLPLSGSGESFEDAYAQRILVHLLSVVGEGIWTVEVNVT